MAYLGSFDDLMKKDDKLRQVFNKYKINSQKDLKGQPSDILRKISYDCRSIFDDYNKTEQLLSQVRSEIRRISLRSNNDASSLQRDFERYLDNFYEYINKAKLIINNIERELR